MNFPFRIELYKEGDYATIYTFRIEGEEISELDRFLGDEVVRNSPDFHSLLDRLKRLTDELGLYHPQSDFGADRWFRDESNLRDHDDDACALWAPIPVEDRRRLKKPYPSLRLYCFRLERMLIVGGGGVKRTQRPEDDPHLNRQLRALKYVMKRVKRRLSEGGLSIVEDGFILEGDLEFESEPLS